MAHEILSYPQRFRKVWWVVVLGVCCSLLWFLYSGSTARAPGLLESPRTVDCDTSAAIKKVAIIGAGSGGSSTAYYINKLAGPCVHTNITVFERSNYVGGRSITVNVLDDVANPVELGASIFVKVNKNLVSAVEEFGLSTAKVDDERPKVASEVIGVFDGAKFVFVQSDGFYWWSVAKLIWKYGMAPITAQNLMKKTVGKFLKMYDPPYYPFRSLSQAAFDLGLTPITATTGKAFLEEHLGKSTFSTEIVQASTRVNYGQNLGTIHGLEAMVCLATDGAMAVRGGNWQIFDGMLRAARANLRLNTGVSKIRYQEDGTYAVHFGSKTTATKDSEEVQIDEFDSVIIAAPLQFTNIEITPQLPRPPDKIPYVELHVTLFSSPHKLSPLAFNLPAQSSVPEIILTTLPDNADHSAPGNEVGITGFFSISTLRTVSNPSFTPPRTEFLYKIFSPQPLTSSFMSRLLGIPNPGLGLSAFSEEDISWKYEKLWHSYPYLYPRVTFDDPQLDWNLWYTSGIESFISTMETSSLSGSNVARLIVDDWLGIARKGPELKFDRHGEEIRPRKQ